MEEYQVGGLISSDQDYNKFCLYFEIEKIILKTLNKCSSYISNVYNNTETTQYNSEAELLVSLSDTYETDDFCEQLLFEQDDDYTFDSENNGLLISLKILANQYTYSDIFEPNDPILAGHVDLEQEIISIFDMLMALNLDVVMQIITTLSWSSSELLSLSLYFIDLDNTSLYKNKLGPYLIPPYLEPPYSIYKANFIKDPKLSSILSIFSILNFGILNFVYYGTNVPYFNQNYLTYSSLADGKNGLVQSRYSHSYLLTQILPTKLITIFDTQFRNLGFQINVATAKGIRYSKPPTIYNPETGKRYGGKIKKTIRHKNIKKTHKKTKNIRNKKNIITKKIKSKKNKFTRKHR